MKTTITVLLLAFLIGACTFRLSTVEEPAPQLAPKLDFSYYNNAQATLETNDGFLTFTSKVLTNCPDGIAPIRGSVPRSSCIESKTRMFRVSVSTMIRTDKKGEALSEKLLTEVYQVGFLSNVAPTTDGGFLGLGSIVNEATKKYSPIAKFNAKGEVEWVKSFDDPNQTIRTINVLKSGDILLAGTIYKPQVGTGFGINTYTPFLLKLDAKGNTLVQQNYGNSGQTGLQAEVIELENGLIVLTNSENTTAGFKNSLLFFGSDLKALNTVNMPNNQLRFLAKSSTGFAVLTNDFVNGFNIQNLVYFSADGTEIRKVLVSNTQLFISKMAATPSGGITLVATNSTNQLTIIRLGQDGTNLRLSQYATRPNNAFGTSTNAQITPSGRIIGTFVENANGINALNFFMIEPDGSEGFRKIIASGKL